VVRGGKGALSARTVVLFSDCIAKSEEGGGKREECGWEALGEGAGRETEVGVGTQSSSQASSSGRVEKCRGLSNVQGSRKRRTREVSVQKKRGVRSSEGGRMTEGINEEHTR